MLHTLLGKLLHVTHDISFIHCWKQLEAGLRHPENRRKFTTRPISPRRVLEVHAEKQRDLSKRGIRKGQRKGQRERWRGVMKDWVITPRREWAETHLCVCECACAHPRCGLSGLQSSRDDEGSQSSFRIRLPTDTHTRTHTVTHRVMRSSHSLPLQSTRKWINLTIKASANSTLLS